MSLLHNYLGGPFGIVRDIYVSKARYCDDPGAKIAGKCGILMYFWGLGFYLSSPLSMENISKYGFVWVWVCGNLSMGNGRLNPPYFHMAIAPRRLRMHLGQLRQTPPLQVLEPLKVHRLVKLVIPSRKSCHGLYPLVMTNIAMV